MNTQLYTDNELHLIADDLTNEDNEQYIFGVLAEMRRRYEAHIAELERSNQMYVIELKTPDSWRERCYRLLKIHVEDVRKRKEVRRFRLVNFSIAELEAELERRRLAARPIDYTTPVIVSQGAPREQVTEADMEWAVQKAQELGLMPRLGGFGVSPPLTTHPPDSVRGETPKGESGDAN